jgi:hypothetical protein
MSVLLPTPSERLVLSRERLRHALREIIASPQVPKDAHPGSLLSAWFNSLKSTPGASGLIEAVRVWWAQHPLRVVGALAADVAKTMLQPIAQRNPLGLMLGAFVVGALLAWSRPWRHILTPALLVGLLPQVLSKAAANMSAQSWIAMLTTLAQSQRRPDPASMTEAPDQPIRSPTNA